MYSSYDAFKPLNASAHGVSRAPGKPRPGPRRPGQRLERSNACGRPRNHPGRSHGQAPPPPLTWAGRATDGRGSRKPRGGTAAAEGARLGPRSPPARPQQQRPRRRGARPGSPGTQPPGTGISRSPSRPDRAEPSAPHPAPCRAASARHSPARRRGPVTARRRHRPPQPGPAPALARGTRGAEEEAVAPTPRSHETCGAGRGQAGREAAPLLGAGRRLLRRGRQAGPAAEPGPLRSAPRRSAGSQRRPDRRPDRPNPHPGLAGGAGERAPPAGGKRRSLPLPWPRAAGRSAAALRGRWLRIPPELCRCFPQVFREAVAARTRTRAAGPARGTAAPACRSLAREGRQRRMPYTLARPADVAATPASTLQLITGFNPSWFGGSYSPVGDRNAV